jgi:hypothetical protein
MEISGCAGSALSGNQQAGWHLSNNLIVPENISILPLPAKSPELNPVENLWQYIALVPVMTRYPPPNAGIFVVRPPGQRPARKVRVLTELMIENFG